MIDHHSLYKGKVLEPMKSEPITLEWLQQYADLSGDDSLIHLNEESAKKAGFSDIVAHGMLSMGIAARLFSPWLNHTIKETIFSVRFISPLYIGDQLFITGEVIEENQKESTFRLRVIGKNQTNQVIIKGLILIELDSYH